MSAPGLRLPGLNHGRASLAFLALGLAALAAADLKIDALHPGTELLRLLRGLVSPDFLAVEAGALLHTIAFAVLGVGLGGSAGLLLSLVFARSRSLRMLCAFLRSIHELF